MASSSKLEAISILEVPVDQLKLVLQSVLHQGLHRVARCGAFEPIIRLFVSDGE